ncbi:MAG: S-layer homology domain-containing protein [Vulcanibacillus sp.]
MKRFSIVLLSIILLLTSVSYVFAEESTSKFKDISVKHWAYDNVVQLVDLGVINGYGDGTFRPSATIQVDQFIKMTVTALGYFPSPSITGYWADPYIEKAKELNLIAPDQFNNYLRAIKREEMAYIIVNAYAKNNVLSQDNLKTVVQQSLNDYYSINDNYKDSVITAYQVGLITGKGNNLFDPRGYTTRAEASTVIMRLLYEDLLKPFDFGNLASTMVTVNEYDEKLGSWIKVQYPFYAPINDKGQPVNEVITLHDQIKAIEKQDYGWFDITFNPYEQALDVLFYPDIETTKLPTMEKVPHLDMALSVNTLYFKDIRKPYMLVIWRNYEHYSDMSTYYSYIDDRYGDFLQIYANVLFENEASYFLNLLKNMLNIENIDYGIDKYYVINNRDVHLGYDGNGGTIFVSDKK